jgi:hypothetical protein
MGPPSGVNVGLMARWASTELVVVSVEVDVRVIVDVLEEVPVEVREPVEVGLGV